MFPYNTGPTIISGLEEKYQVPPYKNAENIKFEDNAALDK